MDPVSRVTRTKAEARANYDRRSRGYERVEGRFERGARVLGEGLLAVRPGEAVLEIGSGPGESLLTFARQVDGHGRVIGIDLSTGMHRVAGSALRAAGFAARVSQVVADGAAVPLRAASVDAVFSSFTLELFDTPELPVVLDEMRRVLRPDGRVVVVSLTTTDPPALMERAYLLAHRCFPRVADCRPIPVVDLLVEAGFVVVTERRRDIAGIPVAVVAGRPASGRPQRA